MQGFGDGGEKKRGTAEGVAAVEVEVGEDFEPDFEGEVEQRRGWRGGRGHGSGGDVS